MSDIAGRYILSRCGCCGRDRNDKGGKLHVIPAGDNIPGWKDIPLCFYCYTCLKEEQDSGKGPKVPR
jgi:hypothetical protein